MFHCTFHLHKTNWSQTFLFLPFPEYIASLPVFYFTGGSPWQSQCDSLAFSPWHEKPCQNNPTLLPRPLLQNFGLFFFCFNQLPPTSGFPRILHICLTPPSWHTIKTMGWSLFWSTYSRYLINKLKSFAVLWAWEKKSKTIFHQVMEQLLLGLALLWPLQNLTR